MDSMNLRKRFVLGMLASLVLAPACIAQVPAVVVPAVPVPAVPEATEALAKSLRLDRNECVRFEAALALGNGCCCNEKTVRALEMSVSMSDKDGAPVERSDRVRAAAADALAHCPLIVKEIEKNG